MFNKSFASSEKSKLWSKKNNLKPRDVFKSSQKIFIFNCDICNHEYNQNLLSINKSKNCPYCANKMLCDNKKCNQCYQKSFALSNKIKFWSKKNKEKPRNIYIKTNKGYWFDCDKCQHEFKMKLNNVHKNCWCPYCAHVSLCDNNKCNFCFENSFASHEKSKFWSTKNKEKVRNIFKSTAKKFLFDCDICHHEFEQDLNHISTKNMWCPYCANCKLCNDNKCKICFNKSFASIEKSKFWSNKNKEKPRNLILTSPKKYWFDCDKCNHSYSQMLSLASEDTGCPYCTNKILCDDDKCDICLKKSFASSPRATCWSKKNILKPRDIFISTGKEYWFDCDKCPHSFTMRADYIRRGNWCSYCANQKLCDDKNCDYCFKKSFASTEKSKCWSKKNEKNPRDVFKASGHKYIFNCDKCDREFDASLDHVNKDKWCPFCITKSEAKLYDTLLPFYPQLKRQYKVDWCKKNRYLPYDFVIEDMNIIIELDGPQHFRQISNWQEPEKTQELDKYKMKCANENKFTVIRLLQEDVANDKYDWIKELKENIEIIKNKKIKKITNIYMCKNDEYKVFLK